MPEFTSPGVYVEEIRAGAKPIEGVPTSTVGFLGLAERGPVTPTLVTSHAEFARIFGSPTKDEHGSTCYLSHAIKGFFQNGGTRCWVARVVVGKGRVTLTVDDFDGIAEPPPKSTGLAGLAAIDEISLLCCPDEHLLAPGVIAERMNSQCIARKDRFAILQSPKNAGDLSSVAPPDQVHGSKYCAFYYPWLKVRDPKRGVAMLVPPGGHIAGIYARTDAQRGVAKAPANEMISGVEAIQLSVNNEQQELLNGKGVNILRKLPGRGNVVWGARTTATDSDWKYINIRRLLIFVETSIQRGIQWAVFEPNGELLWTRVRQAVSSFLHDVWKSGMLQGTTASTAYFVRCDRTTMTQDDIDNGRLIVLIGIAAVKPAEFVIFRIGQWTGSLCILED